MTEDRDPALQNLFAELDRELDAEPFTADVLAQMDRLKAWTTFGWICGGLVLVALAWLLAVPLQFGAHLLTQSLTLPLIELDNRGLAQILSPVNNFAIFLALGLLGLRSVYRKIFR